MTIQDHPSKGRPMTVATNRRMTLKEYLDYDDGTDMQYELEDGVLVEMGTGSTGNTSIGMFLISIFLGMGIPYYRLATKHKIEVRGGYANARYPDLIVHSEASFTAIDGRKEACVELTDLSPMLVIEVVSPGTESTKNYKRDYQWKPRKYADRGIPEMWIVDPERSWVMVGTLAAEAYQFKTFQGEEALTSGRSKIIVSPTFSELNLTAAQVLSAGR
jgi:Uma2 family endonuclease